MNKSKITINNRELLLSNLGKDLYPSYGFSKERVLEYYTRIAPFMLPHLKNRAMTLKRYPDGVEKDFFFEKRCPAHRPPWIQTAEVPYGSKKTLTACVVNDLEALVWVENLASIELHVPLAKTSAPRVPDSVVFDLDPGEQANILDCARVALILKNLFDDLKLSSCVKTSGKKGLHVYVPLNSNGAGFDETKRFSKAIAVTLRKNYPDLVTVDIAKESRKNKVFINWAQNDASKTMVCVYSLRAEEMPKVSFPLGWKELGELEQKHDPEKLVVTAEEAIGRVEKLGDSFREILEIKQRLPYL
ncbi:MAG TPA: non-homologous end-joining DNA ligase [Chitinivibrionales bacterium]|nr:non-homologous end-joining DNA ligase [Chitinivibrionales bacterium]